MFDSLDSTNCEAKRLALLNHPKMWILALEQTRGRGRRGRRWLSYQDNFTASLLFYPNISTSGLSLFSFVAGLALYESVVRLGVEECKLCLKWPNDLLLNGKKIGGILLESVAKKTTKDTALVLGFGLNLVSCPPLIELGEGSLPAEKLKNSVNFVPEPTVFLQILMDSFEVWKSTFLTHGFSTVRDSFLKRTIPIGKRIQVKTISKTTTGYFVGIKGDGSLILDCTHGLTFISAGDVLLIGK